MEAWQEKLSEQRRAHILHFTHYVITCRWYFGAIWQFCTLFGFILSRSELSDIQQINIYMIDPPFPLMVTVQNEFQYFIKQHHDLRFRPVYTALWYCYESSTYKSVFRSSDFVRHQDSTNEKASTNSKMRQWLDQPSYLYLPVRVRLQFFHLPEMTVWPLWCGCTAKDQITQGRWQGMA